MVVSLSLIHRFVKLYYLIMNLFGFWVKIEGAGVVKSHHSLPQLLPSVTRSLSLSGGTLGLSIDYTLLERVVQRLQRLNCAQL